MKIECLRVGTILGSYKCLLGPTTLRKSGVGLPFKDLEYHVKSSKYLIGNSSKKFLIPQNTFLDVSRKPHHF